ncbi:hypothetical protein AVEN_123682-1 [Araneus ventricosus]|uniref:Uncharacterized protein n=1 Tax=Araneus ventricosus TaxID=182803 RepID=A0A4Y2PIV1_ARAVE|nr:hypothetical protein AVEN_123682-1 [Araneus ventricosus]
MVHLCNFMEIDGEVVWALLEIAVSPESNRPLDSWQLVMKPLPQLHQSAPQLQPPQELTHLCTKVWPMNPHSKVLFLQLQIKLGTLLFLMLLQMAVGGIELSPREPQGLEVPLVDLEG